MGLLQGLPLRIAAEWVKHLKASERLQAFECLALCDPYGVAKVPPKAEPLAVALHWHYVGGILLVPAWPLRPPNPNVRLSWLEGVDERIGDSAEGQEIARSLAAAWGGVYHPKLVLVARLGTALAKREPSSLPIGTSTETGTHTISTDEEPLILQNQPLFPDIQASQRHFPLPQGARLVHGVHGDYYTLVGKLQYPEMFERFWKAYPKAVEKA